MARGDDHDAAWWRERRRERFFGDAGIVAAYERKGDPLIEFAEIAQILVETVPNMTIETVTRLFVFAVKRGAFPVVGTGFCKNPDKQPNRRVAYDLVDLHQFSVFARGQYPLRPGVLTVELIPRAMRARGSTWCQWFEAQGWPVPAGLAPAVVINNATPSETPKLEGNGGDQTVEELTPESLLRYRVNLGKMLESEAYRKCSAYFGKSIPQKNVWRPMGKVLDPTLKLVRGEHISSEIKSGE